MNQLPLFGNQRWRGGRDSYRPPAEVIDTTAYEVAPIASDNVAKGFVVGHHYSGTYPAARYRFGLYKGAELTGVAVFSVPCSPRALTNVFGGEAMESVELGRFVLLDEVPGNGETWFLGQCFRALRAEGLRGVLSFSDPTPRTSAAGVTVFPGHVGTIYKAFNGTRLGVSTPRTLRLLDSGQVLSDRAIQKVRTGERGWRYAADQLAPGAPEDPVERRAWLGSALAGTRTLRHPGNLRFAWGLTKGAKRDVARQAA